MVRGNIRRHLDACRPSVAASAIRQPGTGLATWSQRLDYRTCHANATILSIPRCLGDAGSGRRTLACSTQA
jgi:hypothetical protein